MARFKTFNGKRYEYIHGYQSVPGHSAKVRAREAAEYIRKQGFSVRTVKEGKFVTVYARRS